MRANHTVMRALTPAFAATIAVAIALLPFGGAAGPLTGGGAVASLASMVAPVTGVTMSVVPAPLGSPTFHSSESNNWSGYDQGYLTQNTDFTSISATWAVPTATQHSAGQAESSATWIGIGGGCLDTTCSSTDSTLIQAGTEQDVAADGTASYSAWWEAVPAPSVSTPVPVHPGDIIHCSIGQVAPEIWSITLTDTSDGQGFTQTLPYSSSYLTAEWIEEAPLVLGTSQAGQSTLPNLSTVTFSAATVNGQNPGFVPAEEIDLVGAAGELMAVPSSPSTSGDAFNDCTYASPCPAP